MKKQETPFPELSIKPKLQHEWIELMNELNKMCLQVFGKAKVGNKENKIQVGKWEIYCNWVNNDYIDVHLDWKKDERAVIRYEKNKNAIVVCIMTLMKLKQ